MMKRREDADPLKEFGADMQRWCSQLEGEKDWERRLLILQQMHSVFELNPSTVPDFPSIMSATVRIELPKQIADLRSAISREACACVKSLCQSTGPAWEFMSDWFVQPLLLNTCATIAVIADSAEDTLGTLSSCGIVSAKALQIYLQNAGHKHSNTRRNAFASLLRILVSTDPSFVVRHAVLIAKAIRPGLSDAVPAPRQLARMCFWGLEAVAKDEADRLMSGLESTVQRHLEAEQETFLTFQADGRLPEGCQPIKRGVAPKSSSQGKTASGSQSEPSSPHASAPGSAKRRPQTNEGSVGASPSPPPQTTTAAAKKILKKPVTVSEEPAASEPARVPSGPSREGGYSNLMAKKNTRPESQEGVPAATAASSRTGRARTTAEEPSVRTRTNSASARQAGPAAGTGRLNSGAAASTSQGSLRSYPSGQTLVSGATTTTSSTTAPRKPPVPTQGGGGAAQTSAPQQQPSEDGWAEIVAATESSDWALRIKGIMSIAELADMLALSHDQEALKIILERINDSHPKVATASFQALVTFFDKKSDTCVAQLERILVLLLPKVADAKVKEQAKIALDSLNDRYGIDLLNPCLMKALMEHSTNTRLKLHGLEFMLHIAQGSPAGSHYSTITPVKTAIQKLMLVANKDKTNPIQDLVRSIFGEIYRHNADAFVQVVNSMQSVEQAGIIEFLKKKIPHLAQDCRRVAAGQATLPHPPTGAAPNTKSTPMGTVHPSQANLAGVAKNPTMRSEGSSMPSLGSPSPLKLVSSASPAKGSLGAKGSNAWDRASPPGSASTGVARSGAGAANARGQHFDPHSYNATSSRNADVFFDQGAAGSSRWEYVPKFNDPLLSPGKPMLRLKELTLLKNAVSSEERMEAIKSSIQSLSNEALWLEHYEQLLPFALAFARESDHNVRHRALGWLREIVAATYLRTLAESTTEHFFRVVLHCLDDVFPTVKAESELLTNEMINTFSCFSIVNGLLPLLDDMETMSKSTPRVLVYFIDVVTQVYARAGPFECQVFLPRLCRILVGLVDHAVSDVRKAVVLGLIDLYNTDKEGVLPGIKDLPPAKLKLLDLYIGKGGRANQSTLNPSPNTPHPPLAEQLASRGLLAAR
jgi:hypothetical protein